MGRKAYMLRRAGRQRLSPRMVLQEGEQCITEEESKGCLTICWHRLAERWANAQDDPGQDVLVARDEEECGIFGIFYIWSFPIEMRRYKPVQICKPKLAVDFWRVLTMVASVQIGSQLLESECRWLFDQVAESRPFVTRDLRSGAFDTRREMGQSIPLRFVKASLQRLRWVLTEDGDRKDQKQIDKKELPEG